MKETRKSFPFESEADGDGKRSESGGVRLFSDSRVHLECDDDKASGGGGGEKRKRPDLLAHRKKKRRKESSREGSSSSEEEDLDDLREAAMPKEGWLEANNK